MIDPAGVQITRWWDGRRVVLDRAGLPHDQAALEQAIRILGAKLDTAPAFTRSILEDELAWRRAVLARLTQGEE